MTYKITDYNGEEIQGSFYGQELHKTKQDLFRIENNKKARFLSNGWVIVSRLTCGLITKTVTNYRVIACNVRNCVA